MIRRYIAALDNEGAGSGYNVVQLAVSNDEGTICGESPNLYFISDLYVNINTGVTVYTNPLLTVPLTGFDYVKDNGGTIWFIDSATGVVGSPTGNSC